MNFKRFASFVPTLRAGTVLALVAALAACSGTPRPKPAELAANAALLGIRQAWNIRIPAVTFPLSTAVSGDMVSVGASDGTVVMIDARSGQESWRANAGAPLAAGVGSDGSLVAVVTAAN